MGMHYNAKIRTDGLVFSHDMNNTKKSWKGKPTTNMSEENITSMNGIYWTYVGIEDGWKKYALSGTWNSGTYPYCSTLGGETFTANIAYSAQCLIKSNCRQKFNAWGGINYVNDPNMVSGGTFTQTVEGYDKDGNEIQKWVRDGFIYSSPYANPTTSQLGYLVCRPIANGTVFNPATDFVWFKDIQIEESSFATPYTPQATPRTTANAVYDATNKNTMTINNLVYNADGTYSFNGAGHYMRINDLSGYRTDITLEGFVSQGTAPGPHQTVICTDQAYQYGMKLLSSYHGNMACWVGTGTTNFLVTGPNIQNAGNKHIAATRNSATGLIKLYLNGEVVATGTGPTGNLGLSASNTSRIGVEYHSGGYGYIGNIYATRAYNAVLTDAEVSNNFAATRGRYGI